MYLLWDCSLIPISVCIYTVVGGLKATFTSSYLHTVIIFVTMMIFAFKVYASDLYPVGSVKAVWDNLQIMAEGVPVAGEPPRAHAVSLVLNLPNTCSFLGVGGFTGFA